MTDFRPQSFSLLPPVVKNLLIINIILFLLTEVLRNSFGINLVRFLGLYYPLSENFLPTQYFTYLFMHGSFWHLLFNMFALWMFGYTLENAWGSKRFLFFFFFVGVGAGLIQNLVVAFEVWNFTQQGYSAVSVARYMNNAVVIGASGSVYGILLAFGMMYPNMKVYVYFLFPVKVKYLVFFLGMLALFSGVGGGGTGIAHFAHLGGMLFAFILIMYWRHQYRRNNFY